MAKPRTAQQTYRSNAILFKRTRIRLGLSLRMAGKQLGVNYCAINRFENYKPVNVLHYISLCEFIKPCDEE